MGFGSILDLIKTKLGGATACTRFAPSPTGYLHLGHVVNALYVWGIADAVGGKVVLRLENHDRTRCKPEYEAALLEDIEWLRLKPDLGKPDEFRTGPSPYRQSDNEAYYLAAMEQLRADGHVYACDCSRKRILARTGQPDTEELRYDGHCRDRGLAFTPGMTLRLRLPDKEIDFDDLLQGPQFQHPAEEIGDFAIRDNHGHWTYQFAVAVDDIRHGINLIIRGIDILTSTGRQILLAELLGQTKRPLYLHHPLLVDVTGRKLSKRDFAADIHSLMRAGKAREEILLEAAGLARLKLDEVALGRGQIKLLD